MFNSQYLERRKDQEIWGGIFLILVEGSFTLIVRRLNIRKEEEIWAVGTGVILIVGSRGEYSVRKKKIVPKIN